VEGVSSYGSVGGCSSVEGVSSYGSVGRLQLSGGTRSQLIWECREVAAQWRDTQWCAPPAHAAPDHPRSPPHPYDAYQSPAPAPACNCPWPSRPLYTHPHHPPLSAFTAQCRGAHDRGGTTETNSPGCVLLALHSSNSASPTASSASFHLPLPLPCRRPLVSPRRYRFSSPPV
jgi:hypothetical protein